MSGLLSRMDGKPMRMEANERCEAREKKKQEQKQERKFDDDFSWIIKTVLHQTNMNGGAFCKMGYTERILMIFAPFERN